VLLENVIVPARFSGPPNSGNGGYTCALLARHIGNPAEVTLRKPIPIEREMQVVRNDENFKLVAGEELIAEGKSTTIELDLPRPIKYADAQAAAEESPAFKNHPFPTCFVCGPQRAHGDGLRIFPGIISESEIGRTFACAWEPAREFADASGNIKPEFIWSAMDCPTGFAGGFPYMGKLVTGRLAVKVIAPIRAEEKCVIMSWPLGIEGRKHHAAAALFGEDGTVRAEAKATWIKLD
jgi:hypothetical protein